MTARERAEKAIKEMPDYWDESYEAIINTFEQAITAAIEEDRKSRECCKQERDKAIKEIVEIINDVDIHTRKEILEEIDKIRARSESGKGE